MKLYHVVAMADGRVIGKNNHLPWHFSTDLKNFKQLTMGSTVIMGRKTFESIGKPLPGRENFVLTREEGDTSDGAIHFFSSIDSAIAGVKTEKAFIIGGAEIFRQTLGKIDGIYLTRIHAKYDGDTFYPEIPTRFSEKEKKQLQEDPQIEFIYLAPSQ